MPRALWKGSLVFGLVNIPVKLYAATKDRAISFNMLHSECHTPLKYKRWCPTCEREVGWNEIDKGYEITKDKFISLTKEELERIQLKTVKSIDIQKFVDLASIDSIYFNTHYYLAPEEGGEKAYSLLHDILAVTNKAAIGKVVIHNKEHVVAVRPYQKGLVMTTLHYPNEVIDINKLEELEKLVVVRQQELDLAKVLIEHMSGEFKPEEYADSYRQAVMQLIKQKAEGIELPAAKPVEAEATVDLMKALQASVQAAKKEQKPAQPA
jgi:DNA end-binding protein Ku